MPIGHRIIRDMCRPILVSLCTLLLVACGSDTHPSYLGSLDSGAPEMSAGGSGGGTARPATGGRSSTGGGSAAAGAPDGSGGAPGGSGGRQATGGAPDAGPPSKPQDDAAVATDGAASPDGAGGGPMCGRPGDGCRDSGDCCYREACVDSEDGGRRFCAVSIGDCASGCTERRVLAGTPDQPITVCLPDGMACSCVLPGEPCGTGVGMCCVGLVCTIKGTEATCL